MGQVAEGTQRLLDPVSKITLNFCPGVPSSIQGNATTFNGIHTGTSIADKNTYKPENIFSHYQFETSIC